MTSETSDRDFISTVINSLQTVRKITLRSCLLITDIAISATAGKTPHLQVDCCRLHIVRSSLIRIHSLSISVYGTCRNWRSLSARTGMVI